MKRVKLPLFTKFALGISLTVLVFGILNAILVRNSVSDSLNTEFEKRGYFIARAVAEQAVFYILSKDPAGLNSLINEIKAIDSSIYYVFIVSETREVLAHSFQESVPDALRLANLTDNTDPANQDYQLSIVSIRDPKDKNLFVRDFSLPVINRSVGTVRIGILENEILNHVNQTISTLWLMVLIFFLLGIGAALFFSYTISTPLKELSRQSQNIDIKTIQQGLENIKDSTGSLSYRIRRLFRSDDEIDLLYESFDIMLRRLEQTHNAMNQLQQSLMQSEKMASIGTLTAGIAHEINNPLAGLKIGLNRISRNPADARQTSSYIDLMKDALNRMELVIQDLLTFSRKSPHEFEEISACEMLRKVVKLAQYRVKRGNIHIEVDHSKCPYNIHVASNRIEQVFLNIILNAIDSVDEKLEKEPAMQGFIRIYIEDEPTLSRICFEDNGMGVDLSIKGKIFDPFFTTKKIGVGTGLGLSVSYQIVKDHGGEILVESMPGIGATFIVVLPKR